MQRERQHRLASTVGRMAIAYLERAPSHRGQARLMDLVGRTLGPVPSQAVGGVELMVRLDSAMDRSYVVQGTLDHATLLGEIERLLPGDVMVDVGANAGLYSVLGARRVSPGGRVLSFEPSADEFARLAWALRANGVDNVIASNTALADRAGFVAFVPAPSQHTGLHRLGAEGDAASHRVWAERGDVAVQLEAKEQIALLKIDVEGSELAVLRGFQGLLEAGRVGRLVIEISDAFLRRFGASSAELYAYLAALGYLPLRQLPLAAGQQRAAPDGAQYDEVFARR
jgi:FkbM family methyltransferase